MQFVISLLICAALCILFNKQLKKSPLIFYIIVSIISLVATVIGLQYKKYLPSFVNEYVLGLFTKGSIGTALWYIVMMTGTFKSGTKALRVFMPIRRQLCIMAFYTTIIHNITYGKYFFVKLFTDPGRLTVNQIIAAILSLVMIAIMTPLTIISFVNIRKRMNAKKWKQIQKLAYVFYALIYIHLMFIYLPYLNSGNAKALINVCIYTAFFITYFALRIQKFINESIKREYKSRKVYASCISLFLVSMLIIIIQSCKKETKNVSDNKSSLSTEKTENAANKKSYKDGIFSASAYGYDGDIDVTITVENGCIISIEAISHEEDLSYFENAKDIVIQQIIETQSPEVDCVSGATFSSKAIMKAVEKAL